MRGQDHCQDKKGFLRTITRYPILHLMKYQFGFILEQTLGHVTHSRNLRATVSRHPEIEAYWGLPAWDGNDRLGKVPLVGSNWTIQSGLSARRALKAMRRKSRLDALFFHTQVTAVLLPDWLQRIPSIVSLDATPRQYDELGEAYAHSTGPLWLERWKWRLNRDCFRHARHLVTWSEWTRQGLVDEYQVPPEKITVLPPGVDTQAWACPASRTPNRVVKILFVGGDLDRKGGRLLLEAFLHLKEALTTLRQHLPVQGNREGEPELELHLVTRTPVDPQPGVFVYSGLEPNSEHLKSLFFKSDLFCLPTLGDCLPMALSEAGAAGLPAISTRMAAIPEIVQDGKTGFLVPSGDLEALTAALQRLILDPDLRLRLGHAAGQFVRHRFDAGRNVNRLIELMKQISAGSREEKFPH